MASRRDSHARGGGARFYAVTGQAGEMTSAMERRCNTFLSRPLEPRELICIIFMDSRYILLIHKLGYRFMNSKYILMIHKLGTKPSR